MSVQGERERVREGVREGDVLLSCCNTLKQRVATFTKSPLRRMVLSLQWFTAVYSRDYIQYVSAETIHVLCRDREWREHRSRTRSSGHENSDTHKRHRAVCDDRELYSEGISRCELSGTVGGSRRCSCPTCRVCWS